MLRCQAGSEINTHHFICSSASANLCSPEITEIEKLQWSLHGIERNWEEKFFRLYAKENAMTKDKFVSKFVKYYERCTEASKRFELTVFECALNEQ